MHDRLLSNLDDAASSITLLVGENGSGKSRKLADLASQILNSNQRVIAIANTVFDRFPRRRRASYMRLSPSSGKRYAVDVFKRALVSSQGETLRNANLIGKSLQYIGFSPAIGLHIQLKDQVDLKQLDRLLPNDLREEDVSRIRRAFEIYRNYRSQRQSMWIDMYGSQIGPDRRELLELLKYESALKKVGLIENISLTLERDSSIYDLSSASSGELSLLATYAYVSTHIEERDVLLIDEPENSLHPRWQREYCNRLLDQFYYYSPRIVIATHSPQIVQGAESASIDVRIVKMPSGKVSSESLTKSIEGTLFEVFGVLSPANHYLSEKISSILNELVQKRRNLASIHAELNNLLDLSIDEDQRSFLERAKELASNIEAKIQSQGK